MPQHIGLLLSLSQLVDLNSKTIVLLLQNTLLPLLLLFLLLLSRLLLRLLITLALLLVALLPWIRFWLRLFIVLFQSQITINHLKSPKMTEKHSNRFFTNFPTAPCRQFASHTHANPASSSRPPLYWLSLAHMLYPTLSHAHTLSPFLLLHSN